MRRSPMCALIMIAGGLAGTPVTEAWAGPVVYAQGGYDLQPFPSRGGFRTPIDGTNRLTIDHTLVGRDSEGQSYGTSSVLGVINPTAASLMRLSSSAATTPTRGERVETDLYLSYRDRIDYLGPGTPDALLLTFRVEGGLGFDFERDPNLFYGPLSGLVSQFGIFGQDSFSFGSTNGSIGEPARKVSLNLGYDYPAGTIVETESLSGMSFEAGSTARSFSGEYTFRVTRKFDGTTGFHNYAFGITSMTHNFAQSLPDAAAFANLGHTISLSSVALDDGTRVDPGLLRFESGLQLQAVPEPSTLCLVSIGLLTLAGRRVRRKRS